MNCETIATNVPFRPGWHTRRWQAVCLGCGWEGGKLVGYHDALRDGAFHEKQ